MFGLFKRKPQPQIRDVLFGDMPISAWGSSSSSDEPWRSFTEAREHLESGRSAQAVETWRRILGMPHLESRHYLQAWHFLREAGVQPSPDAGRRVYGVVVELGFDKGLDIVVGYEDGKARYFNFSGAAVIWDAPETSLNPQIGSLLHAGEAVVCQTAPWHRPRPPAPPKGQARINMLTPSGLHFGQAPMPVLECDPLGGPVFTAAVVLMKALIAKASETKGQASAG